ncbi:anoctamin-1 isoform X1 [Drosophila willistoni]|uniref:anoctamin-1 isoform X1 n=1 Tax=Drosophila willistoni TaxID=7260 RepID=UPI000C26D3B7|nr:anoctamin-1 isoform X1 [Drosophila willistoni]
MLNLDKSDDDDEHKLEAKLTSAPSSSAQRPAQSEEDLEPLEPPYTAPLAPYDMEMIKRAGLTDKLINNESIFESAGDAMTRFIHQERATSSNESLSLNDKRAHFAESHNYNDSSASTLQLPEGGSLPNGKVDNHHTNSTISTPLLPMASEKSAGTLAEDQNGEGDGDGDAPVYDERECSCPREFYQRSELNTSLFFADCVRSIDFVLAYTVNAHEPTEQENIEKRRVFETNLLNQGLEVEYSQKEQIYFVKIHAPLEVLRRYAEILKLRMPMKESFCSVRIHERSNRLHNAAHYLSKKIPGISVVNRSTKSVFSSLKSVCQFFLRNIYVDERYFPKRAHRFTAIYSRDKEYLFDIRQDCFFTTAVRSRIVEFILDRQRFPSKGHNDMAFGIERLIAEGVYVSAYPLHDGEISEPGTTREILYKHWASVSKWYRYQPLDDIKEYFGVKIGLYFAWLGYYTYMLLLASVVGVICFMYSWLSLKNYVPVKDICLRTNTNITMCPLCDWCKFWDLKETCNYAKITYLIDNPSTIFFAVFMSFWAALFLELWKRYSAEITHRWDLTGFDVHEEHPRPQYLARLEHIPPTRTDYVTNMKEPTVPFWRMKLPATVFSFSVVLLLIALAFVALLAVVVYRMSMMAALKVGSVPMTTSNAIVVATASAAFVNLCLLYVLNYMYNILAEYLTELEMWRTQTQFDDSLTLKIYLLQFVNYYASIFYIAFFKGKFVGHPGQYNKLFDYRQEECSSGGCLTELCIQLAIIMIGKQAFNTILEVYLPMFWRKVLAIQVGLSRLFNNTPNPDKAKGERWMRDFKLLDWGPRSLFPEYLEMVLQYGFVTIFVSAFPLAPFFALLNNILEMRLDAKKLLTHHKRPVSQRVRDIGVWYRILDCIGKLSVITNGFIIAFTSDMIPRLVYRNYVSKDGTLNGYLDFTLSEFKISDSPTLRSLAGDGANITTCSYTDFRLPPSSPDKYTLSNMFYIILACRLGFVVVFENFVALVMIFVRWCIPDMSVELRDQIRREVYVTNEIIIDQEAHRARTERFKRSSSVLPSHRDQDTMDAASVHEPNAKFINIEKLLSADLTQIEMDTIIHGENTNTGISGADC